VIEYPAFSGAVNERPATNSTQGTMESNLNESPTTTSETFAAPIMDDENMFAPPASAQLHTSYNEAVKRFQPAGLMQLAHVVMNPASLLISDVTSDGAPPAKTIEVLGSVKLATNAWPLVGNPDAELIFVELFDYTCPHCRQTHKSLQGAKQKYGERLAVLSLPVPLNSKCNPTVRTDNASHGQACEIAKLAIAVWTIDREKFADFHDYLFESSPSYSQALAEAKTMLDAGRLDAVLRSSLPSDYLERHVTLYQKAGSGQIPKLLFPKITTVGAIETPDAMIRLIEQHLAN
jgi:protein-disulfide isomerase